MSTLKTNTLTGTTSAGSINVTGEGGSTTTNLQQGLAKGWCHMRGSGTPQLDDSLNLGSITDTATGRLQDLSNVQDTTYTDGQVPTWNAVNGRFEPGTGGGAGRKYFRHI